MMRLASTAILLCLVGLVAALAGCSTSADQPVDTAASEEEMEIIAGLKEAMVLGTQRAVDRLAREDGYYGDPAVRIPLPDDAQQISGLLRDADLGYLIDELELAMNRAAENAAAEAAAILVPAAESMIVVRSRNLLDGRDTAVTRYFRQRTANQVDSAYEPIIRRHLEAEPGYQQWVRQIPEKRRELPYLNPTSIDLTSHVNDAAIDGLFTAIGDEERAIRTQGEKRTTELLQAVFGGH